MTEDSYTATESLWELIEGREDLSNFCSIVERARFYRDETHPAYTINGKDTVFYTFKDVLNANSPMTVWAPTNSALSAEEWQKLEKMVESEGYNLQQQFVGNHMALFRKTMTKSGKETFRLINNKFATIDYEDSYLQESRVVEKNIGARNGLLHVIDSRNEFLFNLYEYIKFSGEVKTFSEYLVKRDTTYFLESSSIEGLPDENGNPTYVDSVYFQGNMMFDHHQYPNSPSIDASDAWMTDQFFFRAQLNTEDSAFVMIVPTDLAWANATEKLSPYYNYVSTYPRMDKTNIASTKDATIDIFGARPSYATGKGYETVDSLKTVNIEMDIICPLVFNVNLQPQHNKEVWTVEKFINGGYRNCEYLINTKGDTIRDIYEVNNGIKTLVWSKNSLFENASIQKTMKMSNGCAIITDEWNFPRDFWMRDIDVEANMSYVYDKSTSTKLTSYPMNNTTAADWIDQYGRCSEQDFLQVAGTSNSTNPEATFKLQGCKKYPTGAHVKSGKYDVQVVLVPRWYETSQEVRDTTANAVKKNRLICTLFYWDENLIGGKDFKYTKQNELESELIEYSGEKVDTITVFTDVEFPVTYQHLGRSYPVLQIKCDKLSTADVQKNNYSRAFNVDRIILKSKVEE